MSAPFYHRSEFSYWVIRSFVTLCLGAIVMCIASAVFATGTAVDKELGRYAPKAQNLLPKLPAPADVEGPYLADGPR